MQDGAAGRTAVQRRRLGGDLRVDEGRRLREVRSQVEQASAQWYDELPLS